MKLALDFNGVLSSDFPVWIEYMSSQDKICGHPPDWRKSLRKDLPLSYYGDDKFCRKCFKEAYSNPDLQIQTTATCDLFTPLRRLSRHYSVEVVSSAPSHMLDIIVKWLAKQSVLPFIDKVYVDVHDKGDWAREYNPSYFVEDSPDQIKSIQNKTNCYCFVFDAPYNKDVDAFRIKTLNDVKMALVYDKNKGYDG